jgi:cytosine/adenosine deaminase-related metal-dependent hydrolase
MKARAEIQQLEELGLLGSRTVLVHANAAGPEDIALLLARRCAVVWCPTSNLANYGHTLSAHTLRSGIPIALGTDSAITAEADLLDEIRAARDRFGLSSEEVYQMVTSRAAEILRLTDGEGFIREGGTADLIAVTDEGQTPAEAIFDLRPQMIMIGGELKLASRPFENKLGYLILVAQRGRYFVDADIPSLTRPVAACVGPDFRLAGKRISA